MNTENFLDEFASEARELLESVETGLIDLEKQQHDPDPEIVNKVFRGIHSIKGAAGFLGLNRIGELAHIMETLLSMIRAGEIQSGPECIDALFSGVDLLKKMLDDPGQSANTDISGVLDKIQGVFTGSLLPKIIDEMDASVRLIDSEGNDTGFEIDRFKLRQMPDGMFLYLLKYDLVEFNRRGGKSPVALIRKLTAQGEIIDAMIDVDSDDLGDDLSNIPLVYEAIYATSSGPEMAIAETGLSPDRIVSVCADIRGPQSPKDLGKIVAQDSELSKTPDVLTTPGVELDLAVHADNSVHDDDGEAKNAVGENPDSLVISEEWSVMTQANSLRVSTAKLDTLVNLVGELIIAQARMSQHAIATRDKVAVHIAEDVERLTTALHENTMSLRMIPIGTTFGKFKRLVRDLSKELNKEVEMVTEGAETELDKTVLDQLSDPLVHIVRNSMDHGIEPAETRRSLGKPPTGTIIFAAEHTGAHVIIRISDDGAGMDADRIRSAAIRKGILSSGADLPDDAAFELIFEPGLTTAAEVSDVSGRGVGMDVVKRGVAALRGTIGIQSVKGEGTAITIKLPLTLAIIDGLLVETGAEKHVIPQSAVRECFEQTREDMEKARGNNVITVSGRLLPYICLRERFGISGNCPPSRRIVMCDANGGNIGIAVDRIIGVQKTVIKPLGSVYRHIEFLVGATILGDGSVSLILDPAKLMAAVQAGAFNEHVRA